MGRLADACLAVCAPFTAEQIADILHVSRPTGARRLKELRESISVASWTGEDIEYLAAFEKKRGTSLIADSLKYDYSQSTAFGVNISEADVRIAVHKSVQSTSKVIEEMDMSNREVMPNGAIRYSSSHSILAHTDAALAASSHQMSLLAKWRRRIAKALKQGG